MKLIALGIVALGFATPVLVDWRVAAFTIPTVLVGKDVYVYPERRDHLRVGLRIYRRSDGPTSST